MFLYLAREFQPIWSAFNVVHYVSFRVIASLLCTLICSFLFGSTFIEYSKQQFRSKARAWTPERHKVKDSMPTMGGIFILMVVMLNAFLWCDLSQPRVLISLLSMLLFGAIGAWDDWLKISQNKGIKARTKFLLQLLGAFLVVSLWLWSTPGSTSVAFPFFKHAYLNLGLLFIPWAMFIIVGVSNAVNLTDGLDGLAIGSLIPNFATFAAISYLAGHAKIASYLNIPFAASSELAILGAILVGASLGFLWYNAYPAQIFMGDVGSLALGAGLATIALMAKQEMLLSIAGGLFVLETISVIAQVLSYKFFGRRIFKMAPIHHHFELLGWQESKITMRFAIISLILCLCAMITLKLR